MLVRIRLYFGRVCQAKRLRGTSWRSRSVYNGDRDGLRFALGAGMTPTVTKLRNLGWMCCCALVACANTEFANGPATANAALSASAFAQPLVRLPLPDAEQLGALESLIETPSGYAALYRQQLGGGGGGKSSGVWVHHVALSEDGVHWSQHDLPDPSGWLSYRSLAYGGGHYLLAGQGVAPQGSIARSEDGVTWQEVTTDLPAILTLASVQDRIFALGLLGGVFSSSDGVSFTGAPTDTLQLGAIAYGAGTYIAVGSGPIMVSHDGASWSAVPLDCALPGACVQVPGATAAPGDCTSAGACNTTPGGFVQSFHRRALFGNGHFITDDFISEDAEHWRKISAPARVPDSFAAGWFLKLEPNQLSAWREQEAVMTTTVSTDNPEGLDCRAHRCLLFRDALILVP